MISQDSSSMTVYARVNQWRRPNSHRCWERDWWSKVGLFIYTQFEIDKEKSEQRKAKVRLGSGRWTNDNGTDSSLLHHTFKNTWQRMLKKAFQRGAFTFRAKSKFFGMPIGTSIFFPCLFFHSFLPSTLTHTYNTQVKIEELTLLADTLQVWHLTLCRDIPMKCSSPSYLPCLQIEINHFSPNTAAVSIWMPFQWQ